MVDKLCKGALKMSAKSEKENLTTADWVEVLELNKQSINIPYFLASRRPSQIHSIHSRWLRRWGGCKYCIEIMRFMPRIRHLCDITIRKCTVALIIIFDISMLKLLFALLVSSLLSVCWRIWDPYPSIAYRLCLNLSPIRYFEAQRPLQYHEFIWILHT